MRMAWLFLGTVVAACGSTPTTNSPCGVYADTVCIYTTASGCTYDVPICCTGDTTPHCDTGGVVSTGDNVVSCQFTNRVIRCPTNPTTTTGR